MKMTKGEIVMRSYSSCGGFEAYDSSKPRHHGWPKTNQKKMRREKRRKGEK